MGEKEGNNEGKSQGWFWSVDIDKKCRIREYFFLVSDHIFIVIIKVNIL